MSAIHRHKESRFYTSKVKEIVKDVIKFVEEHEVDNIDPTKIDLIVSGLREVFPKQRLINTALENYHLENFILWTASMFPENIAMAVRATVFFLYQHIREGQDFEKVLLVILNDIFEMSDEYDPEQLELLVESLSLRMSKESDLNVSRLTLDALDLPPINLMVLEESSSRTEAFAFDFVASTMTEAAFRRTKSSVRRVFQEGQNPHAFAFPVISGPSGSGKNRLAFELANCGIETAQALNYSAVFICPHMNSIPVLNSSLYSEINASGEQVVSSLAYFVATLLIATRVDTLMEPEVFNLLMCDHLEFDLAGFLRLMHRVYATDLIFLQIDVDSNDVAGISALLKLCIESLLFGKMDCITRVYPILISSSGTESNDLTTFFDLDALPSIYNVNLSSFTNLVPEAKMALERQIAEKLIHRVNKASRIITSGEVEAVLQHPLFVTLMDEIDGHLKYSALLLDHLSEGYSKTIVWEVVDIFEAEYQRSQLLDAVLADFNFAKWELLIAQHLHVECYPSQSVDYYLKVDNVAFQALRKLILLALTRMPVSKNWIFGDLTGCHDMLDMTLQDSKALESLCMNLAEVSFDTGSQIVVEIPPLLIAALNEQVHLVHRNSLCNFREDVRSICAVESLRVRLLAAAACQDVPGHVASLADVRELVLFNPRVHSPGKYSTLSVREMSLHTPCLASSHETQTDYIFEREYHEATWTPDGIIQVDNLSSLPLLMAFPQGCPVDGMCVFARKHVPARFLVEDLDEDGQILRQTHQQQENGKILLNPNELIFILTIFAREHETIFDLKARLEQFYNSSKLMKSLTWRTKATYYAEVPFFTIFLDVILDKDTSCIATPDIEILMDSGNRDITISAIALSSVPFQHINKLFHLP